MIVEVTGDPLRTTTGYLYHTRVERICAPKKYSVRGVEGLNSVGTLLFTFKHTDTRTGSVAHSKDLVPQVAGR